MLLTHNSTENRDALLSRFASRLKVNADLDRSLVSYQADKETPFYGWFKYREGFTSRLVNYLIKNVHPSPGTLLDPFAGSGTALFAAAERGWRTCGIEVLPVGVYAIQSRIAAERVSPDSLIDIADTLKSLDYDRYYDEAYKLQHIAITKGAFPAQQEHELTGYISCCNKHLPSGDVRNLALYAAFCILEEISYTRKDGQYLRWDSRSGRSQGKEPFDKGVILSFRDAISRKLDQMMVDLSGMPKATISGQMSFDFNSPEDRTQFEHPTPEVIQGSCLERLPELQDASIDVILTSPPYCNRYDYTRTYALELVYLGATHDDVVRMRQAMLSCTVENKTKHEQLYELYAALGRSSHFDAIDSEFRQQAALQEVLSILDGYRDAGQLNNPHITRLVRNYFYEMCFVIYEMARILAPGGHVIMVNDNVRYAGEEVPVDIILSSVAEAFGLVTENIWSLARGKGNSSQQMGVHGRSELRKSVYVWRKPVNA
ncbi:MAG TPA: hypothetical protein VEX13_04505 [Chloroflexia bacterium]|nr:hypothetical protein [Chloroflexia bacterium]